MMPDPTTQNATPALPQSALLCRMLKSQTFSASTAADLDTAINTWTAGAGGKRLVAIQHMGDSSLVFATIYYTEG